MTIRLITAEDIPQWTKVRRLLWPGTTVDENLTEGFRTLESPGRAVIFIAQTDWRDYTDGCETSPVAYVEGWFVKPECRRQGIARKLLAAAEAWGRQRGCTEMASDSELHNHLGQEVHRQLGFEETERIVLFRKPL